MLTQEEDVEIQALRMRGWTVSEIARHTGRVAVIIINYCGDEALKVFDV